MTTIHLSLINLILLISPIHSGYVAVSLARSQPNANSYCLSTYGTTLASIHSAADNDAVTQLCGNTERTTCWIGRHCPGGGCGGMSWTKGWVWYDGTAKDYDNFAEGSEDPNNEGNIIQGAGHSSSDGEWDDWHQSETEYFICNTTPNPTPYPTPKPTKKPTTHPTPAPTDQPTPAPTAQPTPAPTSNPSSYPTSDPTKDPTVYPTFDPTLDPTKDPTNVPTTDPIKGPTSDPTTAPTTEPTLEPTTEPTLEPTMEPTFNPTIIPTVSPSDIPTSSPTNKPTDRPTVNPTNKPNMRLTLSKPTRSPINRDGEVTEKGSTGDDDDGLNSNASTWFFDDYLLYIIIGGSVLCVIIIIMCAICMKKRRKQKLKQIENVMIIPQQSPVSGIEIVNTPTNETEMVSFGDTNGAQSGINGEVPNIEKVKSLSDDINIEAESVSDDDDDDDDGDDLFNTEYVHNNNNNMTPGNVTSYDDQDPLAQILRENNLYDGLYEILKSNHLDLKMLQSHLKSDEIDEFCKDLQLNMAQKLLFRKLMSIIDTKQETEHDGDYEYYYDEEEDGGYDETGNDTNDNDEDDGEYDAMYNKPAVISPTAGK